LIFCRFHISFANRKCLIESIAKTEGMQEDKMPWFESAVLFINAYNKKSIQSCISLSDEQITSEKVRVGDKAPDFTLPDQTGALVSLKDFVGSKIIVLYFYPKDFSRGCTAEACAFRDSYDIFVEAGAQVIGISSQSVDSHKRFAILNKLPFVLLSDEDGKVRQLYGVPSALGLLPGRVTYIIDKKGTVRHVFSSQLNPTKHIEEALRIVKEISKE
jgi:peroxiredoxin Q/BCP